MLNPMTDTVTLYSRDGDGWLGTRLSGTAIRYAQGQGLTAAGPKVTDKRTILYIPVRGGRRTRDALAAESEKTGLFTLLPGDYVALGAGKTGEISGELRNHVPDVLRICAVTDRIYGTALDHWEVEAV